MLQARMHMHIYVSFICYETKEKVLCLILHVYAACLFFWCRKFCDWIIRFDWIIFHQEINVGIVWFWKNKTIKSHIDKNNSSFIWKTQTTLGIYLFLNDNISWVFLHLKIFYYYSIMIFALHNRFISTLWI